MYAQVIGIDLESDGLDLTEPVVRQELVPLLRKQSGFSGALNLTNRERSKALLVLLWETADDASRPIAAWAAPVDPAAATMTKLLALGPSSVTVWEVDARS